MRTSCLIYRSSVAFLLLAYLVAGLLPFRWNPPRRMNNRAELGGGVVRFPEAGLVRVRDADWYHEAVTHRDLHVNLRIKPLSPLQSGPARILTVSHNTWSRNLTVGQDGPDLIVRLRTTATDFNGIPEHVVKDALAGGGWTDVELHVSSNQLIVRVNGVEAVREILPDVFQAWDPTCLTALGNELTWDRPWYGAIARAEAQAGSRHVDFLASGISEKPYWDVPAGKFKSFGFSRYFDGSAPHRWDAIMNILAFIPLGWAVARGQSHHGIVRAVTVCASASLVVEVLQLFVDGRFPSIVDWLLNTCGSALGAFFAIRPRTAAD